MFTKKDVIEDPCIDDAVSKDLPASYEQLAKDNKRFLREEKKAAKEKQPPKSIQQIIYDRGYARKFGITLKPLSPALEKEVQEFLLQQQGQHPLK